MNEGALDVVREVQYPLTAMAVVARVRLIQEVMKSVMKEGEHYGTIPGCKKPSLWKPGAEQLLVTFRIAPEEPKVEDLSTGDSIRYRVTRPGVANGVSVGAGIGECSSDEEKYKWRKPVCDAEFNETPEDRRQIVWKNGRDGAYQMKRVRTNPADVANTILKMADKRAYIAMALLTTAASDCFTQDLEDLPAEIMESIAGEHEAPRTVQPPKPKVSESVNQVFGGKSDDKSITFVPEAYSSKPMDSGSTKHGIKYKGDWYGCFNDDQGAIMSAAAENKTAVSLTWEPDKTGKYKNILTVEAA